MPITKEFKKGTDVVGIQKYLALLCVWRKHQKGQSGASSTHIVAMLRPAFRVDTPAPQHVLTTMCRWHSGKTPATVLKFRIAS
jgi:hypothetical protein